jgi:diguanylate cyclase (GGDEF)-like protein
MSVHKNQELIRSQDELRALNEQLEEKVRDRTADLETSNQQLREEITERKQMEGRLNYLAYYDDLTGIPNRNLFVDRLNQGISRNGYLKRFSAVLSFDIDSFKSINDTRGFDAGDAVLKEVAERLKISTRDGDTVACLGSDYFGVLLVDIANPDDVIRVVEEVMKNVSQPINFKGKEIVLTLGVGVAVYPNDGNDSYTLMKNADLTLSKATRKKKLPVFY